MGIRPVMGCPILWGILRAGAPGCRSPSKGEYVHLKTLTLKGFKSFASATTLQFEPGVTAVVGPNGSGKSNVVDALAWVMGEQGAKSLRGAKMEDVVFAGTAGRPALGRAEVSLTIDNSDGALPIDYTEVTIARIMFRTGGSEYSINGSPCRLLDVQELLSDSGIGREMHVIVGQGQLDTILHATPEDRRGFVEEAAGVLKHRRRKEKSLRKLAGVEEKLSRLSDLSVELRRQLKPLGRQAEVARRAAIIQADVRDARLRLLADDYLQATTALQREIADEEALLQHRSELESRLLAARAREAELVTAGEEADPQIQAAQERWADLARTSERLHTVASVAAERRTNLQEEPESTGSAGDPERLDVEADALVDQAGSLEAEVSRARTQLTAAGASRAQAEQAAAAEESALQEARRTLMREREERARRQARLDATRAAVQAKTDELTAARERAAELARRLEEATVELAAHEVEDGQQTAGVSPELEAELTATKQRLAGAREALKVARQAVSDAERDEARLLARAEALAMAAEDGDGATALAPVAEQVEGYLGALADRIRVEVGFEAAVAAALHTLADAGVVADLDAALAALRVLREGDGGRGDLLVVATEGPADRGTPAVGRWLLSGIHAEESISGVLDSVLSDTVLVADLAQARQAADCGLIAVTVEGDVLSPTGARGGAQKKQSRLELQAAADAARHSADAGAVEVASARSALAELIAERDHAQDAWDALSSRVQEARAAAAALSERGAHLRRRVAAVTDEVARQDRELGRIEEELRRAEEQLAQLQSQEAAAQASPQDGEEPDAGRRDEAEQAARQARAAETDARLALRTSEERLSAVRRREQELREAAQQERSRRAEQVERNRRRRQRALVAGLVHDLAEVAGRHAQEELQAADRRRLELGDQAQERNEELTRVRAGLRELDSEVARITDSVHRDEVARAEQRLRIEQLAERAMADHGIDPEVLIAEYGPDQPVIPSPPAPGDEVAPDAEPPQPYPYERAEQERRLRSAERALALLGRVNPLALEEFAALEERVAYLNEQSDDMNRSRGDLLALIAEVDERVERVFSDAFRDTAVHFEQVFARLFPGGEGRLVLTDPDNMLTTGIEVEARPPGKKIKRLSLLSGGERSLTAVAFLVSLFKARPSPFYVLDEVEAALDDTNLGRLIEVIEELRQSSQLIVITHQKRTMEAADALYGVSMRGDGVSQVISQRLREGRSNEAAASAHDGRGAPGSVDQEPVVDLREPADVDVVD